MRQRGHSAAELCGHRRGILRGGEFLGSRRQLRDDDRICGTDSHFLQQGLERHLGGERGEFVDADLVVGQVAVAAERAVPIGCGHLGLELEHRLSRLRRIGITRRAENHAKVFLVLGDDLLVLGIVDQVIIAVGEPEPRLSREECVEEAVLGVDRDPDSDRRGQVRRGEQRDQIVGVLGGKDPVEHRPCRGHARALDSSGVHESLVDRGDPPAGAAGRVVCGCELVEDRLHPGFGQVAQLDEAARRCAVGRDRGQFDPFAVDVSVEIVAGLGCGIHEPGLHSPAPVAVGGSKNRGWRGGRSGLGVAGGNRDPGSERGSGEQAGELGFHAEPLC